MCLLQLFPDDGVFVLERREAEAGAVDVLLDAAAAA